MTILLVQTLLLMLVAFLLGASLSCLIRRGVSGSAEPAVVAAPVNLSPAPITPDVDSAATDRFGRALVGGQGAAVPPVFHGQPVVEVQAAPEPAAVETAVEEEPAFVEPVVETPEPAPVVEEAPASEPVVEVAAAPEPPPAPPQRDALHPEPVAAALASEPEPETDADPSEEADTGPSYTQIAVAAAAAAMAAAAKARAEAEAAEAAGEADDEQAEAPEQVDDEAPAADQADTDAALEAAEYEGFEVAQSDAGDAVAPLAQPIDEPGDDLTRIHAIDANLKDSLARYGVSRFAQIAAWTADDVRGASQSLGFDATRVDVENWIGQAQILAGGGDPGSLSKREVLPPSEAYAPVDGDQLHRVIGIDPDSEALLRANGVTKLAQIALWTAADIAHFEALIGKPGRIAGEEWVQQARFLSGVTPSEAAEPEIVEDLLSPEPEPEAEAVEAVSVEAEASSDQAQSEDLSGLRSVRSEALRGGAPLIFSTTEIDDLKRIRGIGVLIEKKLNSLGITSYEQVANWTESDIARISQLLDFKGRIERENWIEQARILASGGQTEFSRRVDRGEA